ncbi:MAG: L-seryl-tRNA(Sec) selenium transferase [Acidimicrobiia bacterium]
MDLKDLPSTDALVQHLGGDFDLPRAVVVEVCRSAIDDAREGISAGQDVDPARAARSALGAIDAMRPTVVINATGVLLHTNLGRASLAGSAVDAAAGAMAGAANVEVDRRSGRRSKRLAYLASLLPVVTGAEAGTAVNNTAGALLLSLAALAGPGRRVAVSRGELIEIGGSFRLPELMAASGSELVEVGTTNRTRISDFAKVAGSVDVLLKVHPSNYRIEGFQEQATHSEMVELAQDHGIPFVYDIGSGLIDAQAPWLGGSDSSWLAGEPGVRQCIDDGVDLVLFSGDKLLGGPQAGIAAGRLDLVATLASHPIARAVRLDGPTIASLAMTLEMYADQRVLEIPFWAMAAQTIDEVSSRSVKVAEGLGFVTIEDGESLPGAGSVPGLTIPTCVLRVDGQADAVWSSLSAHGVIGARRDGAVYLDLRSVLPDDDGAVREALVGIG